ncbi:hypothetical protein B9G54_01685 [Alloscardovia macacae]|uniref:Uncharacterized protein n=1 Tax=Alloscardovia macacae TaxID=1160091 RepID=A0A1Y2SVG4_9BIFI|nr:hypothetical protein [Alloscardovia macacae]OTA27257.1 hypothetical protein B9G54_01685 [Alloscardovia macacae]OTA29267.1 hypothetical protein B9T39_03880 [Alloscardovia macacae]
MKRGKKEYEQAELFAGEFEALDDELQAPQWVRELTRPGNPMRAVCRECQCGQLLIEARLKPVWGKYNAVLVHGMRDLTTSILLHRQLDELRGLVLYSTLGNYKRDGWYLEHHDCLLAPVGEDYMEHTLLAPQDASRSAFWEDMPADGTAEDVEEFEKIWRSHEL